MFRATTTDWVPASVTHGVAREKLGRGIRRSVNTSGVRDQSRLGVCEHAQAASSKDLHSRIIEECCEREACRREDEIVRGLGIVIGQVGASEFVGRETAPS